MSFGVSISDVLQLVDLSVTVVKGCKNAPRDFAETGRGAESLHIVLTKARDVVEAKGSPIGKNEDNVQSFNTIIRNCREPLRRLNELLDKQRSLGTSSPKFVDRIRIPRKELLDVQGLLVLHTSYLSNFLATLNLDSNNSIQESDVLLRRRTASIKHDTSLIYQSQSTIKSRLISLQNDTASTRHDASRIRDSQSQIKNKLDSIQEGQDNVQQGQFEILRAIDLLAAEWRETHSPESILSDHTDDDKGVWKELRTKLVALNFRSDSIEKYEEVILERLTELISFGLWSDNGSVYDPSVAARSIRSGRGQHKPASKKAATDTSTSDSDSDDSQEYVQSTNFAKLIHTEQVIGDPDAPKASENANVEDLDLDRSASDAFEPHYRKWNGRSGSLNLSAALLKTEKSYIHLRAVDGEDIIIPDSNLSAADSEYIRNLEAIQPKIILPDRQMTHHTKSKSTEASPTELPLQDGNLYDEDAEIEEISGNTDEDVKELPFLKGKRTFGTRKWEFRESKRLSHVRLRSNAKARSSTNGTALPRAAKEGDFDRVRRLLSRGHNIESRGIRHEWNTRQERDVQIEKTALFEAATSRDMEMAQYLLQHGADPNTLDQDNKHLLMAIPNGYTKSNDMIQLLLEYDADVSIRSKLSNTPLHRATKSGNERFVQLLLDYEAPINAKNERGETALYLAAWEGKYEVVEILLSQGAKTECQSSSGQSPLYKAAGKGHSRVVELLLRYGASPGFGCGIGGESSLYKATREGHRDIVQLLLKYGADPDQQNETGQLPAGSVSKNIKWLVQPMEKPNNEYQQRPLYVAASTGQCDVIALLLDAGADIHAQRPGGTTAVFAAAEAGHKDAVKLLMRRGAVVDDPRRVDPVSRVLWEEEQAGMGLATEYFDELPPWAKAFRKLASNHKGDGVHALSAIMNTNNGLDPKTSALKTALALGWISRNWDGLSLSNNSERSDMIQQLLTNAQRVGWTQALERNSLDIAENGCEDEQERGSRSASDFSSTSDDEGTGSEELKGSPAVIGKGIVKAWKLYDFFKGGMKLP